MRQLGFIPRFRQRLQIQRTKLPAPPPALYADDEDAVKKFNDLAAKKAVANGESPRYTAGQRPEPEPEPEENSSAVAEKKLPASPELFEAMWVIYPRREGRSRANTVKAWNARIKEGRRPEDLLAGAERYAAYCTARGTEQCYIKQPETFFGPGLHFDSEWPSTGGHGTKPGSSKSIAGMNYSEGFDGDGRIL